LAAAGKAVDPIAAAEADIAGSKDLIAAVARDLGQHQRWLAHYQAAERRHARRVMIQQLVYRLERARRRLAHLLERIALRGLRAAKSFALFLWRTGLGLLDNAGRAARTAFDWGRPRAHASALVLLGWLTVFAAWTVAAADRLAAKSRRLLSAFAAWLAARARMAAHASWLRLRAFAARALATGSLLAGAFRRQLAHFAVRAAARSRATSRLALARGALGAARLGEQSGRRSRSLFRTIAARVAPRAAGSAGRVRAAAGRLKRHLAAASHWTGTAARTRARAALAAGAGAVARSLPEARRVLRGREFQAGPQPQRRALAVRRCTALICIEPRRDRLPALRAG
jgi:hypothetical protein